MKSGKSRKFEHHGNSQFSFGRFLTKNINYIILAMIIVFIIGNMTVLNPLHQVEGDTPTPRQHNYEVKPLNPDEDRNIIQDKHNKEWKRLIENEINNNNKPKEYSQDDIHIIFSTSCSPYQDWQSIVQIYSAMQVNQPGKITRIASGCTKEEEWKLDNIYKKLNFDVNLHFTPEYHIEDANGKPYIYFNKCNAVLHWLRNVKPTESVIVLTDPDFMFLDKVTPFIGNMSNLHYPSNIHSDKIPEKIVPGKAVGQAYAMGTRWLNWDKEFICGKGSPCTRTTSKEAVEYAVGPPYILHREDWEKLAPLWVEFTTRIVPHHTEFLAEMFGYSMAAVHLGISHARVSNFMISNVMGGGELWEPIDQVDDFCHKRIDDSKVHLPTFFHFCQSYRLGDWVFYKSRLPKDMLSCDAPLLAEPPSDLADSVNNPNLQKEIEIRQRLGKNKINGMTKQLKRAGFGLCTVYRELNNAFTWYKTKMCSPDSINLKKTFKLDRPAHA